jgi:hypothetical protein
MPNSVALDPTGSTDSQMPSAALPEARAARWIPWVALSVAVTTVGLWWLLAYVPIGGPPVVVVERRGCDVCICANPCPCDCECECSVADGKARHDHAKAVAGAQGAVRQPTRPWNLAFGVAALFVPFGVFALWRRRRP